MEADDVSVTVKLARAQAARAAASRKPRSRLRPPSPTTIRAPIAADATTALAQPNPAAVQSSSSSTVDLQPPTLPNTVTDAKPSREELRARCRAKAARARGMPKEQKLASTAAAAMSSLAARLAAGAGTPEENMRMKEMQDMYAKCGGDLTKMLENAGLSTELIPEVVRVTNKLHDTQSPAAIEKASREVTSILLSAGFAPALASIIK